MTRIFHIDDSSKKAKSLLDFLLTLDFVKEEQESSISKEHLNILNERRKKYLNGKTSTHTLEEVEAFARNSIK